jgi:DNA-3-methyladenine glycosylase II
LALGDAFCSSREEVLRGCGLSGAKVKTLNAIANAVEEDGLCGRNLRAMDPVARAEALTGIWGIGRWPADMANIFWFGESDIWPDGDVTARKTLERLTSKRRKTVRTAARFAPYRSYLTLAMWQIADAPPS